MKKYIAIIAMFAMLIVTSIVSAQTNNNVVDCKIRTLQTYSDGTSVEVWVPSDILLCVTPTLVPTEIPTATNTMVPTATDTPVPTSTNTPVPTETSIPVATNTSVPVSGIRVVPDEYTTISSALSGVPENTIIRVRAGTYLEEVTIGVNSVTITAYGDGPVWLDGECIRNSGAIIRASDSTISGIGIKKVNGAGIRVFDSGVGNPYARLTVENSTIQDFNCNDTAATAPEQNQAGIASWFGGSGYRIVGNQIHYRVELPGVYSTYGRGHGNGIWFKSTTARPNGGGHTITDNIITGGFDGIGGETESDPRGAFDRDTLIARNTIINCNDDGIQVEGGGQNVRVEDNTITNCGVGIALSNLKTGPAYFERNVINSNNAKLLNSGVNDILACFKVGNDSTAMAYVTSNICDLDGTGYSPRLGDGFKQTNTGVARYTVRDNIFRVSRYVIELNVVKPESTFDGDCFYTNDTTRFVNYMNTPYMSFDNFRLASGQEANGRDGRAPNAPC